MAAVYYTYILHHSDTSFMQNREFVTGGGGGRGRGLWGGGGTGECVDGNLYPRYPARRDIGMTNVKFVYSHKSGL